MKSEILGEQIEFETQRIVAAFEIPKWEKRMIGRFLTISGIGCTNAYIVVKLHNSEWDFIVVRDAYYDPEINCQVWRSQEESYTGSWEYTVFPYPDFDECMARGLYCLGIDDDEVFVQLNHPLTAHKKAGLREHMPREFWPKKWMNAH